MTLDDATSLLKRLLDEALSICKVGDTAAKNSKSLNGRNYYADKFHDGVVALTLSENKLTKLVESLDLERADTDGFQTSLATLKSFSVGKKERHDAQKSLRLICETVIEPKLAGMTASPIPQSEQVLPMAVVEGTRDYLERVVQQANGCYEHQWYDACSVMIRRLVETLIIEVYLALNRANEIKDRDDNFLMLSGLVAKITRDPAIHLGRESKDGLPLLKKLGDRAAHNRTYNAHKADIDKVTLGLRVVVEELVHQAALRSRSRAAGSP